MNFIYSIYIPYENSMNFPMIHGSFTGRGRKRPGPSALLRRFQGAWRFEWNFHKWPRDRAAGDAGEMGLGSGEFFPSPTSTIKNNRLYIIYIYRLKVILRIIARPCLREVQYYIYTYIYILDIDRYVYIYILLYMWGYNKSKWVTTLRPKYSSCCD